MQVTPTMLNGKLNGAISRIADTSWLYSKDPASDFTRTRKLPISSILNMLLKFSGKSLQSEISAYYSSPGPIYQTVPSKSAFSQQRKKLLWEGCYTLFRSFTDSLPFLKTFEGYRLLACDGSTVPIPRNESETDYSVVTRKDRRSFNQLHINGLFDILNRIYIDCTIDPGNHIRERAALISMVKKQKDPAQTIILADRGYEGYKDVAHMIESGIKFLIRGKDLDSNGFLHTLNLPPEGPLDIDVDKILTFDRSQAKNNDSYVRVFPRNFDLMEAPDTYPIKFRLVRLQLDDGSYECLVTNLPREQFPSNKLKRLYHLRWGIENAYRDLKYTVDLLHFHGKSAQAVLQELFCSLTMFNFCAYLCVHADILRKSMKDTKYRYKVNFANAVGPCREFLHGSIGDKELLERLRLSPTPIRPDRHSPRHRIREQSSREFNYRAS